MWFAIVHKPETTNANVGDDDGGEQRRRRSGCQVADWPDHKKHCKEMAKLCKDKEAISELAKNT
jgi:hypothetical protein